jgi:DNA-binding CsgD family transcriptional regulator
LLLSDGDRDGARQTTWMRESYSLTKAEAGIGRQLLRGRTAEDIARDRSTSIATVRTHIRHILEKTDSRRIADFIALFTSLP